MAASNGNKTVQTTGDLRDFLANMIENTSRPVAALVNADGEDRGWQMSFPLLWSCGNAARSDQGSVQ